MYHVILYSGESILFVARFTRWDNALSYMVGVANDTPANVTEYELITV